MDLAVVYRIMIGDFNDGIGSALIKNNMLETWGVTLDELHECAMKNTKELLGYSKKSMVETIAEMTGEEEPGFMFELPLFVLSTNNKLFGAITMLDTDLLAGICEEAGINKLAIIPSSIHELIAVTDENIDLNAICSMVAEVNDTEVEPEEILSYNMYSFDYLTRSLDVIYASEGSVTA